MKIACEVSTRVTLTGLPRCSLHSTSPGGKCAYAAGGVDGCLELPSPQAHCCSFGAHLLPPYNKV